MLDHTTVMWQMDVTVKRKNMKNKNNIILIIIFVILVGVLIYIVSTDKKENSVVNESTKSYKYEVVNDYSDFFTIENCVNKYFNYLLLNHEDSNLDSRNQKPVYCRYTMIQKMTVSFDLPAFKAVALRETDKDSTTFNVEPP